MNGSLTAISASLRGRESSGGTSSVPPDTVQFNSKDGQFNFFSNGGGSLAGSTSSQNLAGPLTMKLPMPTPVADFGQKPQANAPGTQTPTNAQIPANAIPNLQAALQQAQQVQNQQQSSSKSSPQDMTASNLAQFLSQQQQQPGNVQTQQFLQQNSQQQQQNKSSPQLSSAQPSASGGQQQQQQPKLQIPFTSDPNTFLQQLQIAQLQQQLQAVQQQALQSQQQQPQNPQVAAALQQLQFAQNQAAQAFATKPLQPKQVGSQGSASAVTQGQMPFIPTANQFQIPMGAAVQPAGKPKPPPTKKTKTASKDSKLPASTTIQKTGPVPTGIVSASSDTEESHKKIANASRRIPSLAKRPRAEPLDTSNMTPEEKAKANRDRNREHARNTRMRKKAYLEELKSTVDELCRERDTLVSERAGAANLLVEMHNTRTEVLMSFFALRSTNEKRRALWSSILDESCFSCSMPVTPYRSFPASEVQVSKCQRTIQGIDGMMADTASLHVLFDSIVDRKRFPNGKIDFRYTLVTEEAVVAGNQMMARWVMNTTNAVQFGAKMDVAKQGMLCCKFNSAHKIVGLELMFDVMAFMLQLKHTVGSDSFSVVPNTVQTCQRTFENPMMMMLSEPPYTIVQVNKAWEMMTGYSAEDVVGKVGFAKLQARQANDKKVEELMQEIRFKRPASACLVQAKQNGETFEQFFVLYPLSTDSRITHFVAITEEYDSQLSTDEATTKVTVPPVTGSITLKKPKASTSAALKAPALMNPHLFASLQQNHANSMQTAAAAASVSGSGGSSMPPPSAGVAAQMALKTQTATSEGKAH